MPIRPTTGTAIVVGAAVLIALLLLLRPSATPMRTAALAPSPAIDSAADVAKPGTAQHRARSKPPAKAAIPSDPLMVPPAPRGAPLARVRADLEARAAKGDLDAASTLSLGLATCNWIAKQLAIPDPRQSTPGDDTLDSDSDARRESLAPVVENWRRLSEYAARNAAYCAGVVVNDHDELVAELAAAKLGDDAAADCFLQGGMIYLGGDRARDIIVVDSPPVEEPHDAVIEAAYRDNALALAEAGVEHGDWRAVAFLGSSYSGSWIVPGGLAPPDPYLAYAYHRLAQLGHTDPEQLAREAAIPLDPRAEGVTDEQVRSADAWAERVFEAHFADVPPLPYPSYVLCPYFEFRDE